jgi:hypothetical protein
LTSLREKLIKIGAKVVSHGRYITFQMAEIAVPRQMFADIPSLIARHWRHPCRHDERWPSALGVRRGMPRYQQIGAFHRWDRQPPASIGLCSG